MPFAVDALPYAHDALNPVIDTETMQLHHGKHHATYVTNLNKALEAHGQLQTMSLLDLIKNLADVPEDIRQTVRNNGGGHANHAMFWQIMGAPGHASPTGKLAEAIARDFGTMETLQTKFNEAGLKQFGSGWVFVTVDGTGKLAVVAKPNQDTPLMDGTPVLMGNDVWEHAYYLTYRNRRADYLTAWWQVVDWHAVQARYDAILAGQRLV